MKEYNIIEVITPSIKLHICDASNKKSAEFIANQLRKIYKERKIEIKEVEIKIEKP